MRSERLAPDTKRSDTRRVIINFAPSIYGILQELAEQSGTTLSEVLRDAIGFKKWWEDVHQEGGRVLVERGGNFREVSRI